MGGGQALAQRLKGTPGITGKFSRLFAASSDNSGHASDFASNGARQEGQELDENDFVEITDLIRLVDASDIVELDIKNTKFSLSLKKQSAVQEQQVQILPEVATVLAPTPQPQSLAPAPRAAPAPAPIPDASAPSQIDGVEITSPMAGTFYRAAAPGEPAFVKVGDKVKKGQTICIIEAMKLMNEIEAEVSGEVVKIEVENGQPVTPGQALMIVKPS
eukprot:TRINITY_DN12154_c0_g1_i1.p2 TRINITY_DN12154_c0_g1~~TRINITY_DN12154_c0_g1_i1.p2  ORF type:complete len:217 (-),score=42.22 TRINITY_DN12154_c0_g1_i1:202-852(-)